MAVRPQIDMSVNDCKIMTTGKAGSLLCVYKPLLLAGLKVH